MFGLWATFGHSLKAIYYALPPIIGCADMPRYMAMPPFPYTAKSQHSFVDSRRRDDTYGLRSLACIQSQSRQSGYLIDTAGHMIIYN